MSDEMTRYRKRHTSRLLALVLGAGLLTVLVVALLVVRLQPKHDKTPKNKEVTSASKNKKEFTSERPAHRASGGVTGNLNEVAVHGRLTGSGIAGNEALFEVMEHMADDPDELRRWGGKADKKLVYALFLETERGAEYICQFAPGDNYVPRSNLRKGMQVTIVGSVQSSIGEVCILSNCRVIAILPR